MKTLNLTDAQANALLTALDKLAAQGPDGATAIIEGDVMRSVYLQLMSQSQPKPFVRPAPPPSGRQKGGYARAASMTPEQRTKQARAAAKARWGA